MQSLSLWILLWTFICMCWPVEVTEDCGKRSEHFIQDTIHNGQMTNFYEYPWLAAVFITGDHTAGLTFVCGGSLISRNVVLTAAHCLYVRHNITNKFIRRRSPEEIIVYLGRYHLLNWGDFDYSIAKEVKKVIIHDDYGEGKSLLNGDIALLVLTKPAAFSSNVQPVCLPDIENDITSHYPSFNGTVAGWGIDEEGYPFTPTPNVANSTIFFNDECERLIELYSPKYLNKVMCAGYKDGKGYCNGDSGGGFYVESTSTNGEKSYFVYGVLAKAFARKDKNCDHSRLSIVTNVLHYMEWIKNHSVAETSTQKMKTEDQFAKEKLEKNMEQCCVQMHQEREYFSLQLETSEDTKDELAIKVRSLEKAEENMLNFANIRFKTATKLLDSSNTAEDIEALTLFQVVTEIRKTYLGEDNNDTISSMFETAKALAKLYRFNESLVLFEKIIESRNKTHGENHLETLQAMHFKAWNLGQLNNFIESLQLYNKVIIERTVILGEQHEDTLQSLQNKAWTLLQLESYHESLLLLENIIENKIQVLGINHASTLISMHSKATVLSYLFRYYDSLDAYNEVIKIRGETLGENHVDTLHAMYDKAHVLNMLGRGDKAKHLLQNVLEKLRLYNKEEQWLIKSTERYLKIFNFI